MLVNTHEAKTRLSELLRRVEAGEEIIIGRGGRPIAKLTPIRKDEPRRPGAWRGRVRIADDFDELPEDVIEDFYGTKDPEE